MKEERRMIENTGSIEHYQHIFICGEDERDNILEMIKSMYPGLDIELIRNGYQVRVIRKKSEKEQNEYYEKQKVKTPYDQMFTEDIKKGKKK